MTNPTCPMCGMTALHYDSSGTGTDIETWIACSFCGWNDKPEDVEFDPLADDEEIRFQKGTE